MLGCGLSRSSKGGLKVNQELAVKKWNEMFRPGTAVEVKEKGFRGKTITPACIRDEEAKVYVDGLVGPVPLRMVTPVPRAMAEEESDDTVRVGESYRGSAQVRVLRICDRPLQSVPQEPA